MPRLLLALVLILAATAFAGAEEVTITVDSTPLRTDASATAPSVGTATRGQRLSVLSTWGDWIRVAQPGTGYGVWIPRSVTVAQPSATLPAPAPPIAQAPRPAPAGGLPATPGARPVAPASPEAPAPAPVSTPVAAPVAPRPAAPPPPAHEPAAEVERPRESRGKFETTGIGVGLGYGYQHAGAGGAVYLYIQGRSPFKLALYGGAGYFPSSTTSESNLEMEGVWGWAAGGMLLVGGRHRAVLDVSYGLAVHEAGYHTITSSRYGTLYHSEYDRVVYGITGAVGYEFMAPNGFFVRPTFGITKYTEALYFDGAEHDWTVNVTVGFRF